ncbi:hypothetical protein UlMin_034373 [Ulmus minor]
MAAMDFSLLNPYLNTLAAGFLLLLVVSFYLSRKRQGVKGKPAPKVPGGWPIFGHLPLLGGTKPPHLTLGALADKYGPIFTIRLGSHEALIVSTSELSKECFTTNDLALASRPKLVAAEHLGYNNAMFAFSPHGTFWREIRKVATFELLSNSRLDQLKHIRISEAATFLKEFHKYWSANKKSDSSFVAVEMKQKFWDLTLNVILRNVAGKRYTVEADASQDQKKARKMQKAIEEFFVVVGAFVPGDVIPYLGWMDLGGYKKTMKRIAKDLDDILAEWLVEKRQKRKVEGHKKDEDFMDVMLSVLGDSDFAGYNADIVNKATVLSLVSAGSDTSAVTLTWAISLLLNNPHVLKKAQEELDTHVGRDRVVNDSDMSKLVYVQAIVKETLRLYPPAPLGAPHLAREDCTIGGYDIPKGTRVMTNLSKIHTDPLVWPEPYEFKPERFLTTHKDVDVKGQNFELTPFGSGRRMCPGASFAVQMLNFALASFLHAFEITRPTIEQIDLTESFGLTNSKKSPLEILVKPRLSNELYV